MKFVYFAATISQLYLISMASTINVKMWQAATDFPDESDFPETQYLKTRPSTAIAFTGGGSRAYVAAIGELAALEKLHLVKNIRYIGGISGGAWATTAYSFAQNVNDDLELLGDVIMPHDITPEVLKEMNPKCLRSLASNDLIAIGLKAYNESVVKSASEAWTFGVSKTYLEPVGINPNMRFSWNAESVAEIKTRNPSLAKEEFLLPSNRNRPFPVIGSSLVGPLDGAPFTPETQNYTMVEITPLYVGQMKNLDVTYSYNLGRKHLLRVGGVVEPFAFPREGNAPNQGLAKGITTDIKAVEEPTSFLDLQYAAAAASYAPGAFFESLPSVLPEKLGLSMNYYAPSESEPLGMKWLFADGGSYENIPLISFLQRRVQKIVLFFNCQTSLQPSSKWDVYNDAPSAEQITDTLPMFFGVYNGAQPDWQNRSYDIEKNQVFAKEDYVKVVTALQTAQAQGRGIIATMNLTTVENSWWGVPAGFTSQITFFYLGRLAAWEKLLTPEMRKLVTPESNTEDLSNDVSHGPFRQFPHYATLGGSINHERANLLSDLTGWAVLANAELFHSIFS